MEQGRIFVIGDVHGCSEMLKRLVDKIGWEPANDRLIFVGDYIDRGEDSRGVVEFILALKKLSPNITCLIGNHEAIFLDYLSGMDRKLFLLNGGMNTLESYEFHKVENEDELLPPEHKEFFNSLERMVELDRYYVVHAGFKPGIDVGKQEIEDMIWIRDSFIYSDCDFGKKVIFGHTPFYEPFIMDNKIGIDTGAVYGNRLTCLELPEFRFHWVEP